MQPLYNKNKLKAVNFNKNLPVAKQQRCLCTWTQFRCIENMNYLIVYIFALKLVFLTLQETVLCMQ